MLVIKSHIAFQPHCVFRETFYFSEYSYTKYTFSTDLFILFCVRIPRLPSKMRDDSKRVGDEGSVATTWSNQEQVLI